MSDDNVSLAVRDAIMRRETSPDGDVIFAKVWIESHTGSVGLDDVTEEYTIKARRVIRRRPADGADD